MESPSLFDSLRIIDQYRCVNIEIQAILYSILFIFSAFVEK
jgi:hypothetical protein